MTLLISGMKSRLGLRVSVLGNVLPCEPYPMGSTPDARLVH